MATCKKAIKAWWSLTSVTVSGLLSCAVWRRKMTSMAISSWILEWPVAVDLTGAWERSPLQDECLNGCYPWAWLRGYRPGNLDHDRWPSWQARTCDQQRLGWGLCARVPMGVVEKGLPPDMDLHGPSTTLLSTMAVVGGEAATEGPSKGWELDRAVVGGWGTTDWEKQEEMLERGGEGAEAHVVGLQRDTHGLLALCRPCLSASFNRNRILFSKFLW